MNAVTNIQPSRMPIPAAVAKEFEIQPADWRVLVEQIFPTAKSIEAVMMALAYCRKRNLDIFKKPVHIVPMWSSAKKAMVETVWPGIAEIRTTATRTKQYAGIDAVEFGPMVDRTFTGQTGGQKSETISKKVRYPEWASVVVYRIVAGQRCAYHAKVFWEETYATMGKSDVPNDMWAKRSRGQLDKCVEAAALRKAFPEELGNVYAAEEMEGRSLVDSGDTIEHVVTAKAAPTPPRPPALSKPSIDPEQNNHVEDHAQEDEVEDQASGTTIDHETGEVTDQDDGEKSIADMDNTEFFQALEARLGKAEDPASVEEIWTEFDALSRFEGDEDSQGIATAIKRLRLKTIGV
jgi:phage recombination protein Bet